MGFLGIILFQYNGVEEDNKGDDLSINLDKRGRRITVRTHPVSKGAVSTKEGPLISDQPLAVSPTLDPFNVCVCVCE